MSSSTRDVQRTRADFPARGKSHRNPPGPALLIALSVAVSILLVWAYTCYYLNRERSAHVAKAQALLDAVVKDRHERTLRLLQQIDQTSLHLRSVFEADVKSPPLDMRALLTSDAVNAAILVDARGIALAGTSLPDGDRSFADRAYFQYHVAHSADNLHVGGPVTGRLSGRVMIPFSRRVSVGRGSFAGVVAVLIRPETLTPALSPAAIGTDAFSGVMGVDGVYRALAGTAARWDGARASPEVQALARTADATAAAAWVSETALGPDYLVRVLPLDGYELFQVVGTSLRDALRDYVGLQTRAIATSIAATIVLGLFATLLCRQVGRLQASARALEMAAYVDSLTGIGNRAQLERRVSTVASGAHDSRLSMALLIIAIDHFKYVNDLMGHAAGDDILRQMAERLKQGPGTVGELFRVGGDEFAYFVPEVFTPAELRPTCERLLARVHEPIVVLGKRFDMTASIGVATSAPEPGAIQTLLRDAVAATSDAKAAGRNAYRFFSEGTRAAQTKARDIEQGLRSALDGSQFFLVYQPKIELAGGQVVGVEALIRWDRPGVGVVPPGDFIPVAESSGLIDPLGEWVVHEACRQLAEWISSGMPVVPVAVNVAASQFTGGSLARSITSTLRRHGVPPHMLEIEITESVMSRDRERTKRVLSALRDIGVHVAMDDFGTGYSSLSALQEFLVSTLKIDRSLLEVATRVADFRSTAVLRAALSLGDALGLKTVAEGVETPEQLALLKRLGCHQVQGFLFARPMRAADLVKYLAQSNGERRASRPPARLEYEAVLG